MKTIVLSLLAGVVCLPVWGQSVEAFEPFTAPPCWVENFTHEDDAVSRVLVFSSVPGVSYTVETSHDLVNWTKGEKYYGLGQEIAISMIQTAAAPNPPPAAPPGTPEPLPMTFVSLLMRPASTGGLILSWRSLDHQQTVEHHCASLTLGAEWNESVLYMNHFGSYHFSISHPLQQAVPKANVALATKDAAMVAAFEAHFEAMSQEVEDSVERSRLNPVVATPADPMSRKFYRIVADWSLDSDDDLSPDWLEFMAMLGMNGLQPVTTVTRTDGSTYQVTANPLGDAKTAEGVLSGKVADSDADGSPDAEDVNPASGLINWERKAVRYAMFPVEVPQTTIAFDASALQTNDKGQVLFRHAVWQSGALTALNAGSFSSAYAVAFNNEGNVLGVANSEDAPHEASCLWTAANAAPSWITATGPNGGTVYAMPTQQHYFAPIERNDRFTDSRRFFAAGMEIVPGDAEGAATGVYVDNALWQSGANGLASYTPAAEEYRYVQDPNYTWKQAGEDGLTTLDGQQVKASIEKLIVMPFGPRIACGSQGSTARSFFKYLPSQWTSIRGLDQLTDFSHLGLGITADHLVWQNNTALPLPYVAPGASSAPWNGDSMQLMDLSTQGHLLVTQSTIEESASGPTSTYHVGLGVPFMLKDNDVYDAHGIVHPTGVDNVSQTATVSLIGDAENSGFQKQLWVMAPQGTWTNSLGVQEPNRNEFKIITRLGGQVANLSYNNASSFPLEQLVADETTLDITGVGTSTTDGNITISMGGEDCVTYPIGVKSMKRRTVNVHLFRCQRTSTVTPGEDDPYPYDIPLLTAYLNKLYGAQINVYFNITASDLIAGQNNQPNPLYSTVTSDTVDYMELNDLPDFLMGKPQPANVDIRVFAIGHTMLYDDTSPDNWDQPADGIAPDGLNTVIVGPMRYFLDNNATMPNPDFPRKRAEHAMRTLAHEIGHVIVGSGHPDENSGPAILPGTDHSKRLMCSGNKNNEQSRLLVKREWDKAEEWLKARETQNSGQGN